MYNLNSLEGSLLLLEDVIEYAINMPHDRLVKDILSDKKEFCDFINIFCNGKEKLIPENIEKVPASFINLMFKNEEADILYKKIDEEKYYLVEHQSTVDYSMSFRLLKYCVNILNNVSNEYKLRNKDYKIPKIIPIVLYTGNKQWNASTELSKKQVDTDSDGTLLELKYKIIDVNKISEEYLLELNSSLAYGMLLEKNKGKENLIKILDKIAKNYDNDSKELKMRRIIKYILAPVIGENETERMLKKFKKIGGDEVMTAIQCLLRDIEEEKKEVRRIATIEGREEGREKGMKEGMKEGIKEGRKEGMKEGMKEGRKNMALKIAKELLKIGMDSDKVAEITQLTQKEIEEIL